MSTKNKTVVPKGKPKSGRTWKGERKTFSSMQQFKRPIRTSWETKTKQRMERAAIKSFESELKSAKKIKVQEKHKKMEEKRKRKEENEKKSEIVQVIRNTAKLKRMSKKQMRSIKKADTNP